VVTVEKAGLWGAFGACAVPLDYPRLVYNSQAERKSDILAQWLPYLYRFMLSNALSHAKFPMRFYGEQDEEGGKIILPSL